MTHPHPDEEFASLAHDIAGPDGALRHREHVNIAFAALRRYGMPEAVDKVCDFIRLTTVYTRRPQKYHHTVSRAWVELVAHHVIADADLASFEVFAQRHPALLDKRLLGRHYRSATLASEDARHGWTAPDLLPFPFSLTG